MANRGQEAIVGRSSFRDSAESVGPNDIDLNRIASECANHIVDELQNGKNVQSTEKPFVPYLRYLLT